MSARSEPIVDERGDWRLTITDDCPIEEGRTLPAHRTVTIERWGKVTATFPYPGYRIYTLLAHWADDLPTPAPELSEDERATVERFGIHDEDKPDDVEGMRFGAHLVVGAFIISAAISIGVIAAVVSLIHGLVTR